MGDKICLPSGRAQPHILPREFYNRRAPAVARALLGKLVIIEHAEGACGGIIVEAEAYLHRNDLGCHAYRGRTPRNAPMFGPPGHAYVYFTYGHHFMLNAVCSPEGIAEAVLIRALQPTIGIEQMQPRRGREDERDLCSGPGKLCQALAIDRSWNEVDLCGGSSLRICEGERMAPGGIVTTTRVGLRVGGELPLRYYVKGNAYVSRK